MYKKVSKNLKNPYGIVEIKSIENEMNRPFVLEIVPIFIGEKMLNGYLSRAKELLKMSTNSSENLGYFIEDIPFDLYIAKSDINKTMEQFIKKIPGHDIQKAKEVFNNVNILTFCNGNYYTNELMNMFHEHLKELEYTEDEIKEILAEVSIVQVVDNLRERIPYGNTIILREIHDWENIHPINFPDEEIITVDERNSDKIVSFSSFGEDSLKNGQREHNLSIDFVFPPVINQLISSALITFLMMSLQKKSKKDAVSVINEIINDIKIYFTEYIKNNNVDIDSLTKSDLASLKIMLDNYLYELLKQKFGITKNSDEVIQTRTDRESLFKKDFEQIENLTGNINSAIEDKIPWIIKEIQELSLVDDKEKVIEYLDGNNKINIKISDIINIKIKKLKEMIKLLIEMIKELQLVNLSPEMKQEVNDFVKDKLNALKVLLNEANLNYELDEKKVH